ILGLDLTINLVDTSIESNGKTLFTLKQQNVNYQWLRFDSVYTQLNGENKNYYTPTKNGSYACKIELNGCIDTTSAIIMSPEDLLLNELMVYPIPTGDHLTIKYNSKNRITD